MRDDVHSPESVTPTVPLPPGEDPADPCLDVLRRLWPSDTPGSSRLGRFEVLRKLGCGGQGIVFLALDPVLGCKVALKVLWLEALLSDEARGRFLTEARAAAALDHPNIVPIREAGEAGPLWYIASAYCEGPTLAAWLTERGGTLPPREAAELVASLADAVEYMHGRGILHRDLKPGNILLTAAADGLTPRITDFGLAKVRDVAGDSTSTGAGFGTPAYMAPEQVAGAKAVGPAADVYSLGAILYELLAGRPPLEGPTPAETHRMVITEEPARLRRGRRGPPRDLEATCLKCLRKEPATRYATAAALAGDLRRYLDGKPTVARPLTVLGRAGKWLRRRPAFASLIAVSTLALLGLAVTLISGGGRGRAQEPATVTEPPSVRQEEYAAAINDAWKLWEQGELKRAGVLLDQQRPRRGKDLRGFECYYLNRLVHPRPRVLSETGQPYFALALSPDGKQLAAAGPPNTLRLWDTATWDLLRECQHDRTIYSLAFSPDGTVLASAGGEGDRNGLVELREAATGNLLRARTGFPGSVEAIAYSHEGKYLAVCGPASPEDMVDTFILGAEDLRGWWEVRFSPRLKACRSTSVAFSPVANELAVGWGLVSYGGVSRFGLFRELGRNKQPVENLHTAQVLCVAYSPGGEWLACGSSDQRVSLQHIDRAGQADQLAYLDTHPARVRTLGFTSDGRSLAAGCWDGVVRLWDFPSLREQLPGLRAHAQAVRAFTFTRDGQSLITAGEDGAVKVWDAMDVHRVVTLPGHGKTEAWCVAFSPDGKTLASGGDDRTVRLWAVATGKAGHVLEGHGSLVTGVAFSPDGKFLATVSYARGEKGHRDDLSQMVKLWDVANGKELRTQTGHGDDVRCVAFSPDGQWVATGSRDRTVRLWNLEKNSDLGALTTHDSEVRSVAFSSDGKRFASASNDGTIRLWDVASWNAGETLKNGSQVWSVAFSPDGKILAAGDEEGVVRFWKVETGAVEIAVRGKEAKKKGIRGVAFSPDGKTLATGGEDRTVRIWQAATGNELLSFPNQSENINSLAFSSDGTALAAALHDGTLRIWHAPHADD
jgi:WD40 repeat protein